MLEEELYEPMRAWLEQYLTDKYKGHEIIVVDTHSERLDRALQVNMMLSKVGELMHHIFMWQKSLSAIILI